jgi:hypothetical protein
MNDDADNDLGRILSDEGAICCLRFPFTGLIDSVTAEEIYPERKSYLEFLFEEFMAEELGRQTYRTFEALGFKIMRAPSLLDSPSPVFLDGQRPCRHTSWESAAAAAFAQAPIESFGSLQELPTVTLRSRLSSPMETNRERFTAVLQGFLEDNPDMRQRCVGFQLLGGVNGEIEFHNLVWPSSRYGRTVGQDLADCWDGMRRLPYSDEVLAKAISYLAAVWMSIHSQDDRLESELRLGGDGGITIEMCLEGGQDAASACKAADLLFAVRQDIGALVKPEYSSQLDDIFWLLRNEIRPQHLFDFDRFVPVFGAQLVPHQFVLRKRQHILFSPVRLARFGVL